jgi:hypothetical protein
LKKHAAAEMEITLDNALILLCDEWICITWASS